MIRKILSVALVIFWMVFIYSFSAAEGEASGSLSRDILVKTFEIITPYEDGSKEIEDLVETWHFPFRKCAHFFIYFILGGLVMNALLALGFTKRAVLLALIISIGYACFDEVHQLYVDGRSGNIADVCLDSSGACLAIYLFSRFILLRGKNEKIPSS